MTYARLEWKVCYFRGLTYWVASSTNKQRLVNENEERNSKVFKNTRKCFKRKIRNISTFNIVTVCDGNAHF